MKNNIKTFFNRHIKFNRNILIPSFIIFLFILLNTLIVLNIYTKETEKNNSNILRLHVIANSNLVEDQIVKLKVYENITEYIKNLELENNIYSKDEIISKVKENISDILTISDDTISKNNLKYRTSVNIGKMYYDKRQSVLLDMDKGNYDSIKIILGAGNGKNIWTLISPSEDNLKNISNLNTIIPGIDKIYNDNNTNNQTDEKEEKIDYSIKIFEIYKNLKSKLS